MNSRIRIALLAVAFGLAACSVGGPAATPSPTPSQPPTSTPAPATPSPTSPPPSASASSGLAGRQFLSTAVTSAGADYALVPGTRIRLAFEGDNLSIQAGCNTMAGEYWLLDGQLMLANLATTEIGCQPDLMAQDQWLSSLLGSRPVLTLSGDNLIIDADGTVLTLLDRKVAEPDQPLVLITWGLSTIFSGQVASSIPQGVSASFLFRPDGRVDIEDGCNSGGATYAVTGDRIQFGQLVMTKKACTDGAGQVEQAVSAVLNAGSVSYSIDGNSLTLQAGENGLGFSAAIDI